MNAVIAAGGGGDATSLRRSIIDLRRRSRPASDELVDEFGTIVTLGDESTRPIGELGETSINNNALPAPWLLASAQTDGSTLSPVDSLVSFAADSRRQSRVPRAIYLRRPTITIHDDGRVLIGMSWVVLYCSQMLVDMVALSWCLSLAARLQITFRLDIATACH